MARFPVTGGVVTYCFYLAKSPSRDAPGCTIKEILDLRREAQETLIVYGDLSKEAPAEERRVAADAFRRVGAGLVSRHVAAYPWVKWCIARFFPDVDIHSAGMFLMGFAKATQFHGFSHVNISPDVALLRQSLRLPILQQPPVIRALIESASEPPRSETDFD